MMLWRLLRDNERRYCKVRLSQICEFRLAAICGIVWSATLLAGCESFLPAAGPTSKQVQAAASTPPPSAFQLIDVNDAVTRRLLALRKQELFSEALGNTPTSSRVVGPGDVLEVWIWEASPALLFAEEPAAGLTGDTSGSQSSITANASPSHGATLPDQIVDDAGTIFVPFAGHVPAAGKTLDEISAEVARRLEGKANQPEIMVRLVHSSYGSAVIVGDVTTSTRLQLLPGNDRVLDALAAAAGVRTTVPVSKTVIRIARRGHLYGLPLEAVIQDPEQNVPLQPGDVVTVLFQPYTFTMLGSSGKPNDEVAFEAQGITLAQALARSGGLDDQRSHAKGVFLFRLESKDALDPTLTPPAPAPNGRIPVVYRFDLSDPRSFFVMQTFPIDDHDVLYVSDAPAVEMQKFLTILVQAAFPIATGKEWSN
jgi:polysaccharide biosynthesis/export protein